MWQRFSERARKVVFYAQEEAQKHGEGYVSTEHLLLGLMRDDDSTAVKALLTVGIESRVVREEVLKQIPTGELRGGQDMTLTPRAKHVIDLAYDEARYLGNNHIGTEHLLLGLVREGEGLAGRVLSHLGVTRNALRAAVVAVNARAGRPAGETPSLVARLRGRFDFGPATSASRETQSMAARSNEEIWQRLTPRARTIVTVAREAATARRARDIGAEHLVLALLADPTCRGMRAIANLGADLNRIDRVAEALASGPPAQEIPDPIPFSPSGQMALSAADVAADAMGNGFVGTEHLALVLFGGAVGEFVEPETLQPSRVHEAIARSQAEE